MWCYTKDPLTRWDWCQIILPDNENTEKHEMKTGCPPLTKQVNDKIDGPKG